jgi:excisionase family DNA binding protein
MHDRWLSLGEASAMLNVHPSTLRRWADGGLVPCQRTPGGHRRFSRQSLMPLVEGSAVLTAPPDLGTSVDDAWPSPWGEGGQPEALREVWQRLGGVTAQYVVRGDVDDRLLADARGLGEEIASRTLSQSGRLGHAVSDYLAFRSRLLPIALGAQAGEAAAQAGDVARFDRLLGEALQGVVEGFENPRGL